MTGKDPKLDLVNVDVHTKFGQILSIPSHEILTSTKLDHVNVDVHTKFGQILSIRSQDIERKRNSDVNIEPSKGNNSSANLRKMTCIDT